MEKKLSINIKRKEKSKSITAFVKKGENGMILTITGSAKTTLDVGYYFSVGANISIKKGKENIGIIKLAPSGGLPSTKNTLTMDPVSISLPNSGKNYLELEVVGAATYWTFPQQPVSRKFSKETLSIYY